MITRELRFQLSHPPTPKAVPPTPGNEDELGHYPQDLQAYQKAHQEDLELAKVWKEAQKCLEDTRGAAQFFLTAYDNGRKHLGAYDLNPAVGVVAMRERIGAHSSETVVSSQSVKRPHHFWQKARYANIPTDYSRNVSERRGHLRQSYSASLSLDKYPSVVWESASDESTWNGSTRKVWVEADHRTDQMVWREQS